MLRKTLITVLILIFIGSNLLIFVSAGIEKKGVTIDPLDYESDSLWLTDKDDEIEFKVESNIRVDVYIMTSDDYLDDVVGFVPSYENAKHSEKGITSIKFTYEIPDDQSYYLVISNPNNATATVDYEITNVTSEEAIWTFLVCVVIAIIIVGVIILFLIYYFAFRKKKKPKPQPPGYYPPPPPQYPPPPPPQQYPPPPDYPPQQLP